MTRRTVTVPDDWREPQSAAQLARFLRLPLATRAHVAGRAYRMYQTDPRIDRARCWGAALGEVSITNRRQELWT